MALLVGVGVAAAIVGGPIGLAQSYLEERISQQIIFDQREQVFDRLVHQSVGFYARDRAGEVMSRIGNDVNAIENVVADTMFGVARIAIVTSARWRVMVSFEWRLTPVALVMLPGGGDPDAPRRPAGLPGARGAGSESSPR